MGSYRLTEDAQQDLLQIHDFTLSNWGKKQSLHYLSDLQETIQLLSDMPSMGKNCHHDLEENVYRYLYGSHVIYYLIVETIIVIVAILHQNMVPRKHLNDRLK